MKKIFEKADTDAETLHEDEASLTHRPKAESDSVSLTIHPLPEKDGAIVSIQPPKGTRRTPCDVVLVIDISGSMGANAPAPEVASAGETEENGLSVLDLTKHAARAIIETMNDDDRVGIVTFDDEITTIQPLKHMTKGNKTSTWDKVQKIYPRGMTNLWQGILRGRSLFDNEVRNGSVSAIMVLTDGAPNVGCPPQGYVRQLRMYDLPVPIHTFGFGARIGSSLLQSIAEVGGGNFAYISDPSMLATVFIHAIAAFQSTFARSASLTISASEGFTLSETMGAYIKKEESTSQEETFKNKLTIPLGGLQYGQSRDVFLKYGQFKENGDKMPTIEAQLQCHPVNDTSGSCTVECTIMERTFMPQEHIDFHRNRAMFCSFVSSLAPITREHQRSSVKDIESKRDEMQTLIATIRAMCLDDEANTGLLEDLEGQIKLAALQQYFKKWGYHYLLSMYNAHFKQLRTSFKDPGPQAYGKDSPIFTDAVTQLTFLFDELPAPKPFVTVRSQDGSTRKVVSSMRNYNRSSNPCFAAESEVKLSDGTTLPVKDLKKDMKLWTPKGERQLVAILETIVENAEMCRIGKLSVTPWHPICENNRWIFPNETQGGSLLYTGTIYSLLLQEDALADAHAVEVGGQLATTLGHGITIADDCNDAVRFHEFFGNYRKVWSALQSLPVEDGVFTSAGVQRDEKTGLVSGFIAKA